MNPRVAVPPTRLPRAWRAVLLATFAAALIACEGDDPVEPAAVTVSVSPPEATVGVGATTQFSAIVENASSSSVVWQSANTNVAVVDANGNVTGMSAGQVLVGATAIAGNGATGYATVTVTGGGTVAVQVSPTQHTMTVGNQYTFGATVIGTADSRVTWSSSSTGVATVSPAGVVSAVAPGTTSIRATSVAVPAVYALAIVTVNAAQGGNVEIVVTNALRNTVNISVNGVGVGSVPPSSTRQAAVPWTSSLTTAWSLVRSTTAAGAPIGDVISATFSPVTNPGTQLHYTIDADLEGVYIFRPVIANQTAVRLLMGVNEGLQSQNRCECVVSAFSSGTQIGYYRLFSNSNVRAYRDGTDYTGGYIFWNSFLPAVDPLSGYVLLTATFAPTGIPSVEASPVTGGSAAMVLRNALVPRSDVHDVIDPVARETRPMATLLRGASAFDGSAPLRPPNAMR